MEEKDLPLVLPEVDKYLPTETGEPPLARAANWTYTPHLNPPRGGGLSQPADSKNPAYQTADKLVYGEIKNHAREKRKNLTEAEEKLWEYLKDEQTGYKIRRQHIIDTFIGDFVCLEKKVVIEVDGGYHQQQKDEDAARTMMINLKGFSVIRYTNEEVLNDPKSVQQKIKEELDSKILADNKVLPHGEDLGGANSTAIADSGSGYPLETTTMPGWAGSSWYYLRYMDANNKNEFVSKEAANYWKNVDLYIGGSEHATGHLLYVRFWTKFLHDLGYIPVIEPAKKLINQGMIQGVGLRAKISSRKIDVFDDTKIREGKGETADEDTFFYRALLKSDKKGFIKKYGSCQVLLPHNFPESGITNEIKVPYDLAKFADGKYYIDDEALEKIQEKYAHLKDLIIADIDF
ncbi:MAG: DUF559 domain-containing protein [Bacteroidetes bacterium]|nr:DUF559 domain-containing protein [Bacteroidota bacterium]